MAAAYAYAEGSGPISHELELTWQIERFGAQAVMGRHYLGAVEIRRMTAAGNVLRAYRSREDYVDEDGNNNWAEWAGKYPDLNRLLLAIEVTDGE